MIFTQPFPWHSSVEFNFVHITHRENYIAVQLGYNTTREKLLLLESLVSDKTESFLGVRIAKYLQVCQGISNRCQGHKIKSFPRFFLNLNRHLWEYESMEYLILKIKRRTLLALQNLLGCLCVLSFDRLPKSAESLEAIYRKWRKSFPRFFLNLNRRLWEYEAIKYLILKIKRRPLLALQNLWGCLSVFSFVRLPKSAESLAPIYRKCWPWDVAF